MRRGAAGATRTARRLCRQRARPGDVIAFVALALAGLVGGACSAPAPVLPTGSGTEVLAPPVGSPPAAAPAAVPPVEAPGQPGPPGASLSASTAPEVPVGLAVGQRAPSFSATLLDGREITDADLRAAGKPYILYFFATW